MVAMIMPKGLPLPSSRTMKSSGIQLWMMAPIPTTASRLSYQCEKALEVMRQRLSDENLNLAQVAEAVFISPGYLSKRMKEETGYTFKEMLIRLRMERAAELIIQGGSKVYEIAEQTGYQNYRSFSAAFENYYGVSAKKYRGKQI